MTHLFFLTSFIFLYQKGTQDLYLIISERMLAERSADHTDFAHTGVPTKDKC